MATVAGTINNLSNGVFHVKDENGNDRVLKVREFQMQEINYARIKKDCFWDLNVSEDDIKNIIKSDDERKKRCFLKKYS